MSDNSKRVRLSYAQMDMLDDVMGGNLEAYVEGRGKTYVDASDEQLAYLAACVLEVDEDWLMYELECDSDFVLMKKEECAENLYNKLMEG